MTVSVAPLGSSTSTDAEVGSVDDDPSRAFLARRDEAEEGEAGAFDDRRLADAVGRHDEGRARLEVEVEVFVGPPVLQRQPADHASSSRPAATSTSEPVSAASTSRVIASR